MINKQTYKGLAANDLLAAMKIILDKGLAANDLLAAMKTILEKRPTMTDKLTTEDLEEQSETLHTAKRKVELYEKAIRLVDDAALPCPGSIACEAICYDDHASCSNCLINAINEEAAE